MQWTREPANWLWAAVAAAFVLAGAAALLRLYRRCGNGLEAAITALLALLIPVAVAVKLAPEGVRGALAAGVTAGVLAAAAVTVVLLTRRSHQDGRGA
jgi:hypothetical protein